MYLCYHQCAVLPARTPKPESRPCAKFGWWCISACSDKSKQALETISTCHEFVCVSVYDFFCLVFNFYLSCFFLFFRSIIYLFTLTSLCLISLFTLFIRVRISPLLSLVSVTHVSASARSLLLDGFCLFCLFV